MAGLRISTVPHAISLAVVTLIVATKIVVTSRPNRSEFISEEYLVAITFRDRHFRVGLRVCTPWLFSFDIGCTCREEDCLGKIITSSFRKYNVDI